VRTPEGTLAEKIRRGEAIDPHCPDLNRLSPGVRDEIIFRIRYRGYIEREERQIEKLRHLDHVRIPENLNFAKIKGLRAESAEKLQAIRPQTLGQANRISGVNPADISILLVRLAQ